MNLLQSSSSLQLISNPQVVLTFTSPNSIHHISRRFTVKASNTDDPNTEKPDPTQPNSDSTTDEFDTRLTNLRLRYKSGTGKKAEARKSKKTGTNKKTTNNGSSSNGIFLPPVSLKEPVSEGLKVDFGISPYSERINGRIALLGLTALVLVELATGESVIKYHSPSIIFLQLYFVAAVSAIYVKVEKEKNAYNKWKMFVQKISSSLFEQSNYVYCRNCFSRNCSSKIPLRNSTSFLQQLLYFKSFSSSIRLLTVDQGAKGQDTCRLSEA